MNNYEIVNFVAVEYKTISDLIQIYQYTMIGFILYVVFSYKDLRELFLIANNSKNLPDQNLV